MKKLFVNRQANLFEQFANPQFEISEDYRIIDQALENKEIVRELAKDFPDVTTGRDRTPVEQTLRFLVLKHQKGLDYRSLERTLKVNLEDRWFCKISTGDKAPCFKTLQNQIFQIKEKTVQAINERVIQEARKLKMTKGKRMRVDSTVSEANIHHPSDVGLIADCIKVITRKLFRSNSVPKGYRHFKKVIKQRIKIIRTIGRRNKEARKKAVQEIIKMGKHVVRKVKKITNKSINENREILETIINQSEKVLKGEKVKNRIVSIFETNARPFVKNKPNTRCEFGKEVQIQEDEHFITAWQINNKTSDPLYFPQAIKEHQRLFGKVPSEVATDRGYYSAKNYQYAKTQGVKHISLPKRGKLNQEDKQKQKDLHFRKLQRWRSGGEAKISLLKRKYGLTRSFYKKDEGMARWVGAGILACNLATFARLYSG
jgi:IS5 family transposase